MVSLSNLLDRIDKDTSSFSDESDSDVDSCNWNSDDSEPSSSLKSKAQQVGENVLSTEAIPSPVPELVAAFSINFQNAEEEALNYVAATHVPVLNLMRHMNQNHISKTLSSYFKIFPTVQERALVLTTLLDYVSCCAQPGFLFSTYENGKSSDGKSSDRLKLHLTKLANEIQNVMFSQTVQKLNRSQLQSMKRLIEFSVCRLPQDIVSVFSYIQSLLGRKINILENEEKSQNSFPMYHFRPDDDFEDTTGKISNKKRKRSDTSQLNFKSTEVTSKTDSLAKSAKSIQNKHDDQSKHRKHSNHDAQKSVSSLKSATSTFKNDWSKYTMDSSDSEYDTVQTSSHKSNLQTCSPADAASHVYSILKDRMSQGSYNKYESDFHDSDKTPVESSDSEPSSDSEQWNSRLTQKGSGEYKSITNSSKNIKKQKSITPENSTPQYSTSSVDEFSTSDSSDDDLYNRSTLNPSSEKRKAHSSAWKAMVLSDNTTSELNKLKGKTGSTQNLLRNTSSERNNLNVKSGSTQNLLRKDEAKTYYGDKGNSSDESLPDIHFHSPKFPKPNPSSSQKTPVLSSKTTPKKKENTWYESPYKSKTQYKSTPVSSPSVPKMKENFRASPKQGKDKNGQNKAAKSLDAHNRPTSQKIKQSPQSGRKAFTILDWLKKSAK